MFKEYDKKIKEILSEGKEGTDWKSVLADHIEMIVNIQHERLIHLLVTIFVGTVMSLLFLNTIATEKSILLILDIPLLFLFAGYLIHYRFLENTTQKWYGITEQIKKHL
jgi:hypothetical protein